MSEGARAAHDRELYLEGLKSFNAGDFYGCHDVLEDLWLRNRSALRPLFQGLIQLAASYHVESQGRVAASARLRAEAVKRLSPFAPSALGLEVGRLLRELEQSHRPPQLSFRAPTPEEFAPHAGQLTRLRVPYPWRWERRQAEVGR